MQLTDVHIGGGWMSFFKDRRAIDCVVRMVTVEQPDLVAVTGDIAYRCRSSPAHLTTKPPLVCLVG